MWENISENNTLDIPKILQIPGEKVFGSLTTQSGPSYSVSQSVQPDFVGEALPWATHRAYQVGQNLEVVQLALWPGLQVSAQSFLDAAAFLSLELCRPRWTQSIHSSRADGS